MSAEPSQLTSRVWNLRAAATQVAVLRTLGVQLSWQEALELGAVGSLDSVVRELRTRLRLERTIGSATHDADAQRQLAVAEVAIGLSGRDVQSAAERRETIESLVAKFESAAAEAERAREVGVKLEGLLESLQASGTAFSHFVDRVNRLRTLQRNRIHVELPLASNAALALEQLDEIYARHLEEATLLVTQSATTR